PIAGVNVGRVDGEFIINPSLEEQEKSDLELTVAGTKDAINMVEAGANEIEENVILDAIMFAHEEIIRLVEFQEEIIGAAGVEKSEIEVFEIESTIKQDVESKIKEKLDEAIQVKEKHARENAIEEVKEAALTMYEEEDEETIKHVKLTLDHLLKEE